MFYFVVIVTVLSNTSLMLTFGCVHVRPVFSRVDKKRGTYRVKESVHLNRPTVEPNRVRKQSSRRGSGNGENSDQPMTGNAWAARRNSTQVLQLSEFVRHLAAL